MKILMTTYAKALTITGLCVAFIGGTTHPIRASESSSYAYAGFLDQVENQMAKTDWQESMVSEINNSAGTQKTEPQKPSGEQVFYHPGDYDVEQLLNTFRKLDKLQAYTRGYGLALPVQEPSDSVTTDTASVSRELEDEIEQAKKEIQRIHVELDKSKAQNPEIQQQMEQAQQQLQQSMQQLERLQQSGELQRMQETLDHMPDLFNERPFLGITISDLNFKKAYENHYNYNYGVEVTGVVKGTAADRAGIVRGDIIMEFDGQKVRYSEMFKNMLAGKNIGDTVRIKLFRNEKIYDMKVAMEPKNPLPPRLPELSGSKGQTWKSSSSGESTAEAESDEDHETEGDWGKIDWDSDNSTHGTPHLLSAGYGGGGWLPVWFTGDWSDVNHVIEDLGFQPLNSSGLFLNGGVGKGPIGKGWYIGGMGAGYSIDHKKYHTIQTPTDTIDVVRRLSFSTSYGGVTLDRRYRLSKNIVLGTGFMLGGAGTTIEVSQTSGNYDWNTFSTDFTQGHNSYLKLHKSYLMFQPRVMGLIRITSWFGIRSEVGYLLGYSFKSGWNAEMADDNFEVDNSPSSNLLNGFTFSVGPWFGF